MSYKACENCGERIYKHGCVNCNEILYIEDQYDELGMQKSEQFERECAEKRNTIPSKTELNGGGE